MITGVPQRTISLSQLKLVIGAMIFGEVSFAVVVAFLAGSMGGLSEDGERLRWILLGVLAAVGASFLAAFPLVRAALVRSARQKHSQAGAEQEATAAIAQSFFTATLIRSAMAESFGLAGLVFLLVTGHPLFWAAPALSIALLLAGMPSQARVDDFIREVKETNPYST